MSRRTRARPEPRRSTRFRPTGSALYGVLRRSAMRDVTGKPARCWASLDEQRGGGTPDRALAQASDGKPGYATAEVAEAAAAEVAEILGRPPRGTYRCPRRDNDLGAHFHIVGKP